MLGIVKGVAANMISMSGCTWTGTSAHRGSFIRCPFRPLLVCCALRKLAVEARFRGGLGPQHGRVRLSRHAQRGTICRPQLFNVLLLTPQHGDMRTVFLSTQYSMSRWEMTSPGIHLKRGIPRLGKFSSQFSTGVDDLVSHLAGTRYDSLGYNLVQRLGSRITTS